MDKREIEAIQREALSGKSGVYAIFNEQAGKIYIGSAVDIWRRWNDHKRLLRANKHRNSHLQNSWNKYGEREFSFVVVEFCEPNERFQREQYYLDMHKDKWDLVYNIAREVEKPPTLFGENNPFYGKKHSEETRKKQSEVKIGENNSWYGKHHTDETKKKISEALKGENAPMYGKHHNEETKQKISKTLNGRVVSEETKKKLSEANKGRFTGSDNLHSKTTYVYDKNYNLLYTFGALSECIKYLLDNGVLTCKAKNPVRAISSRISCYIKNNKPYKGFIFSYEPIKKSA